MKSDGNVKHAYRGELQIDYKNGVIEFYTWDGQVRLLRITHLPDPIPAGTSVDLVALEALTSYTPAQPIPPVLEELPGTDERWFNGIEEHKS